jgi:hypothetical protein
MKAGYRLLYAAQTATTHLKNASKNNQKSKPESQKPDELRCSGSEKQDPLPGCESVKPEPSLVESIAWIESISHKSRMGVG